VTDGPDSSDTRDHHDSRFETAFRTAPDAVTINRLSDGTYLDVNESFSQIFGYTSHDALGRTSLELGMWFTPEDRAEFVAAVRAASRLRDYEAVLRHKDGRAITALISTSLIVIDDEECILTFTRDITNRRLAETELLNLMNDLERSNQDLQRFAHSASHDLQEPLRMVSIYTALLKKRYHGQLDADADDFIDYAVEGAQRMSRLLEDLLAYSSVNVAEHHPTEISSQVAVEAALGQLRAPIRETGAVIEVGPLPAVCANEAQLMLVFQNLISNSIKFTAAGDVPHIVIGAKLVGDTWVFSVTDEGIGIDPGFHEQVFVLFHRLQSRAEYPGTGFGLTLSKRIVERQGGTMWVESSGDHGTTICFSLPA